MRNPRRALRHGILVLVGAGLLVSVSCQRTDDAGPGQRVMPVVKSNGSDMVLIAAGDFRMGSNHGQDNEKPVHTVHIDTFLMDRYPVTQAQFAALHRPDGSHFKGTDRPVEQISWTDAAAFCNARSRAENLKPCYDEDTGKCDFSADGYRLPTEAEWEYACRADTSTDFFFGNDPRQLGDYAWFAENSDKQTHPVGRKKPNPWGLYDMYGNVAQWCNDVYSKDYYSHSPAANPHGPDEGDKYVLRGGAWNSKLSELGSARRVGETPGFEDACFARDAIGFRCVRKAPPAKAK
ncbi:MAG TPA: SUMF1/EgtB/PvdO family nonheme iron enzyme [Gemmataceae bacterium]|nr:SUMF1/EgtB/PvdO family nonheme iron enzyme [Gemmataceae bacterium]